MIFETLEQFINRTLVEPEYRAQKCIDKFERDLIFNNIAGYFEPSWVINCDMQQKLKI